ncbi:MAG TPA: NB-ARC domain-containing protein [Planctomycetota bacterium]|jgi:hypothetical protein
MDWITQALDRRIRFALGASDTNSHANFLRVKIEYGLVFLLGRLWNSNLARLDIHAREATINRLFQPTIGAIVEMCRTLDIDKDAFAQKALTKAVNRYPALRNDRIGHGFTFVDGMQEFLFGLREISACMYDTRDTPLSKEHDLILVQALTNDVYSGINFKANGSDFISWRCPRQCGSLQVGSVYALNGQTYSLLSPFVFATADQQFYAFRDVQDRLTGKIRYNSLFQTTTLSREWPEFIPNVANDGTRVKSANGTVTNVFKPNYHTYIDFGMKKQIVDFLLNNRASVSATIWGHGGVGKTATVQSICEDLAAATKRDFDYIVFASAKDRYYDYYTGSVQSISERTIDSYESIVRCINGTIGAIKADDIDGIVGYEGRLLIVVDDYETFSDADKQKIAAFILRLDINHHKVLITTRANIVIGMEFQTNELDVDQTANFLLEVLRTQFSGFNTDSAKEELTALEAREVVHSVTSGRPLFIFQLAFIWAQQGTLNDALKRNIKQEQPAIEFLYGRIHDYLSENAKRLFVAISQLVTENDDSNLIEKLQYVVSLDTNQDAFRAAFEELVKLRLVEVLEERFFRVYSKEILNIMSAYFTRCDASIRGSIIGRIKQVTLDKKLDNEHALLETANSARYSRSEEEVVSQYRQILNRGSSPGDVRLSAALNLADYLFNARGKKTEAVSVFRDHEHLFLGEPLVFKMHANYCWALDRKQEAIRILSDLFSRHVDFRGEHKLELELKALYLTYASIAAIEKKEALKTRLAFGEVKKPEYDRQNADIRREFQGVFGFGYKVFGFVRVGELSTLPPSCRENVQTGLLQLVMVCIRINKFEEAKAICEYGCEKGTQTYAQAFRQRLSFIDHCAREYGNRRAGGQGRR